jgi:hypothetical protein
MPTVADLPFVVGILVGPPLALVICVLLMGARQPRWVLATAVAPMAVAALASVAYWYLWGKAFEYADTYRPVPPELDRASSIAIAAGFVAALMVAALGASRLVVAWNNRHKSGLVPST